MCDIDLCGLWRGSVMTAMGYKTGSFLFMQTSHVPPEELRPWEGPCFE
jgi:hypothetical protein